MTTTHTADVDSALVMWLEEIEAENDTATEAGAGAIEARDMPKATPSRWPPPWVR